MAKYKKVDAHTIRIIIEKADDVPVATLLKNLKHFEQERDKINKIIDNINEILQKAVELEITPEVKEKDVEKNQNALQCQTCKKFSHIDQNPEDYGSIERSGYCRDCLGIKEK